MKKAPKVFKDRNDHIWKTNSMTAIGSNYLNSHRYNALEKNYLEAFDLTNTYDLKAVRSINKILNRTLGL